MKHFDNTKLLPSIYEELRTVLVVHKNDTMAEAARSLGVTPPTVSRQVSRVRAALGLYPFVKADGEWRLNPVLMNLMNAFETAEGMLASELRRINQNNPGLKREVKIAGPPSLT